MHKEILTKEQVELLPLVKSFSKDFGLVGGTAIALRLGHRHSIDFDLFTNKEFDNFKIRRKISKFEKIDQVIRNETGEYTLIINKVRFTFFHYPFKINFSKNFSDVIKLPDLLTLGAMKAYALGRRAKWKDYVDLYFIAKKYRGLDQIIKKSKKIFRQEFNEKLFRTQLAYFKDIDYSEKVSFLPDLEISDEVIKKKLIEFSLNKI
ncbi:nucleotidyl transferase AbiEii/AbiGii toxin family protein [Patescibacteria group bacterium]|nr:nucleotidyl transferase AbiEii/AbiGii toxin family protein [Patescibacteria group bacterium]